MTLKKYYFSFKSLSGAFAALFAALPFLSKFFPGGAYIFPPLGDLEAPARIGALLLAFAATYAVYFIVKGGAVKPGRLIAMMVFVGFIGLLAYLVLFERFVRAINIPSMHETVYVTVGYERTAFATTNFDSAPDEELLRARGPDEEQLRILWTFKSLAIARLTLFLAYSVMLLALVAAFSVGVGAELSSRESR
jgi:hypothetical protein